MFAVAFSLLSAGKAHAATIDVAAGNDETTVNSNCSLSEAIININNGDATSYPECSSSNLDPFGSDDAINLPLGAITLTANLPLIISSVVVHGRGTGQSIINSDSQYLGLNVNTNADPTVEFNNLTTVGFFNRAINVDGSGSNASVTISKVEVDGTNATTSGPLFAGIVSIASVNLRIEDTYIHDMTDATVAGATGMLISVDSSKQQHTTINRVTIDNVHSTGDGQAIGINLLTGLTLNLTPGTLSVALSNSTLDSIISSTAGAAGISAASMVNGGDASLQLDGQNNTLRNISGGPTAFGSASMPSGAFRLGAASLGSGDLITGSVSLTNTIISNSKNSDAPNSCTVLDATSALGGLGTATLSMSSSGGNLSDDTTCAPYFTRPTDQNNVGNLVSTLGTLSNNGGYVPTIPLLQGSPAIDAGVNVPGLITDARLATRPQGTAFDSGAYESPYSKAITTASLANTGQNITLYILTALTTLTFGSAHLLTRKFKS